MTGDRYTAFAGGRRLAHGSSEQAAAAARAAQTAGEPSVLIFDDATGEQVEGDPFAHTPAIAGRRPAPAPERPGRGRPRLGVVPRKRAPVGSYALDIPSLSARLLRMGRKIFAVSAQRACR